MVDQLLASKRLLSSMDLKIEEMKAQVRREGSEARAGGERREERAEGTRRCSGREAGALAGVLAHKRCGALHALSCRRATRL